MVVAGWRVVSLAVETRSKHRYRYRDCYCLCFMVTLYHSKLQHPARRKTDKGMR